MATTVHVTFRDIAGNTSLETLVRERAAALESTFNGLRRCRVLIEVPHRRHRSGNRYHVRIDLAVPGDTLVVSHRPSLNRAVASDRDAVSKASELDAEHRDAAIAIREAFDIARRRLQEYAERLHARA